MKPSAFAALLLAALLAIFLWLRSDGASDGAAAGPEAPAPTAERGVVELDHESGAEQRTAVAAPIDPEPEANERAEVEPSEDPLQAHFELIVLDEADERPLSSASVLVEELGSAVMAAFGGEPKAEEVGVTDANGRFLLESSASAGRWVRIEARGYGVVMLELPDGFVETDPPLVVRARRTAALVGRIESPEGGVVRVLLASSKYFLVSDASAESFVGGDLELKAKSDELGYFSLDEVPSGVPFEVDLIQKGQSPRRLPASLVLEPSERREVRWELGATASVDVLALEENGDPAVGLHLRLIRGAEVFGVLVREHTDVISTAVTDGGGLARFERVSQGDWVVAPGRHYSPGELTRRVADEFAPEATRFSVGAGDEQIELELTLHGNRTISGLVLAPDGSPAPRARVMIDSVARGIFDFESTDEEGRFTCGSLVSGLYTITAEPGTQSPGAGPSESVEVETGAGDVTLNLLPAAALVVELRDPVSGASRSGQIILHHRDRGHIQMMETAGVTNFNSLAPGEYELAGLASNGTVGLVERFTLLAGADPKEIAVPLGPGGRVRVAFRGTEGSIQLRVLVEGRLVSLAGLEHGLQETLAAPAGRVTVRGTVILDELDFSDERTQVVQELEVDVPDGGIVDVVFD